MKLYQFIELSKQNGSHWFDSDTMRFFRSRVSNWDVITGYFITSEKPQHGARKYSIRRGDFATGKVVTVSEFCAYGSIGTAKTALKRLLKG